MFSRAGFASIIIFYEWGTFDLQLEGMRSFGCGQCWVISSWNRNGNIHLNKKVNIIISLSEIILCERNKRFVEIG